MDGLCGVCRHDKPGQGNCQKNNALWGGVNRTSGEAFRRAENVLNEADELNESGIYKSWW